MRIVVLYRMSSGSHVHNHYLTGDNYIVSNEFEFGRIQPWTAELAALDQFKKSLNLLLENYSKYFDDLLSGERSLPFGLLVTSSCRKAKVTKFDLATK